MMRDECREGPKSGSYNLVHYWATSWLMARQRMRTRCAFMPFPSPFPLSHAITSLAGQAKGWREALPWHMG